MMENFISDIWSEENVSKRKTYVTVNTGGAVGNDVDIDKLFIEQTQRSVKEKCCHLRT